MLHYTTYEHDDSNEWVTFIHGAGGSSSIWFRQLRAFRKRFNVLLIDLRGHGQSKGLEPLKMPRYTFEEITEEVREVIDHLRIQKSHFIGISLGTIIVRELAERHRERVQSMIMAGAVMKMNLRGKILMRLGVWFKSVVPYLLLYRFFAFIIMPRKAHRTSRLLFIEEAKKLAQKEFIRWFKLAADVNAKLKWFRTVEVPIPTLYLMGDEDHMFLPSIKHLAARHKSAELVVVPNSGHVVNIDQPEFFNDHSIRFIEQVPTAR
ncbi:alpha/beta hydrolase [Cryomorphaceae bacterium]|nr:alpha/beta hydrolase [Cryomorphaceae bacterium]